MPIYTFYKIVCKDENIKDCYVGRTKNLKRRWNNHKSICNNENRSEYNFKLYQFIRENGNIDNWDIIEIEKNEYDDKNEVDLKERFWIKELNANLNIQIPSRTRKERNKEYRDKNKDRLKDYKKEYREKNKITCECGCEIFNGNLARHFRTKKHIDYLSLNSK